MGGQTIEATVCKTDPFELGIHWQGRDFKINLSGASKAAIQSRNPSLGATIKVRIKGGPRPDNIQADIID